MTHSLIQVENLSKLYRIRANADLGWWRNRGVLTDDIMRMANRLRGKPAGETKVNFWALKDISLEAYPGDVIGIIGRNGAGKSTLLKILGRVTEPTGGRAVVFGRVGSLLEVGTGFHSELTGRENIFISGAILGMPRAEIRKKFDEIVDFSGVEEFLETPVKRYSSGMEVRLAFSVAAHLNPNILLVDEVLSVGDASFREKSLRKIREVAHNGGTILFVSHNMTTMTSLCNKAIVLEHGKIAQPAGPVAGAIEHYLSTVRQGGREDIVKGRRGASPLGVEITSFEVQNEAGVILEELSSGRPVNFVIDYQIKNVDRRVPVEFEILIKSLNGDIVTRMETMISPTELTDHSSNHRLICHVEKLPLASTTVSISVSVVQNQQVLDKIDDVFVGRVEIPNSTFTMLKSIARDTWVVMDHEWRIEN